jgi:LmbE family N-acetylglucosaminyl deacetylase
MAAKWIEAPEGSTFLIIAPHPDDEVIGCGGTVLKLTGAGAVVDVLMATTGAGVSDAHMRAVRRREAERAAIRLGVRRMLSWNIPDNAVGMRQEEATGALLELLDVERYDAVFLPSPLEIHPDHAATARIFARAQAGTTRDLPDCYAYEVWTPIIPNYLVDISRVIEQKRAALAEYLSQLALKDLIAPSLGLNAYRGLFGARQTTHAEAFFRTTARAFASLARDLAGSGRPTTQMRREPG